MAMILKNGEEYFYKGIKIENPYGCIDQNNGNKRDKEQHFVFEIYSSQADRNDRSRVLESESYTVTGEDFDTWFSCEAVQNDGDQYQRAYEYIKQLEENIGTENEPEMVLKYSKWEDLV